MTDPRREEFRAISIQCVAEMFQGLTILEREVIDGARRRDVWQTVNQLRHLLRTLQDSTMRDGRWTA